MREMQNNNQWWGAGGGVGGGWVGCGGGGWRNCRGCRIEGHRLLTELLPNPMGGLAWHADLSLPSLRHSEVGGGGV